MNVKEFQRMMAIACYVAVVGFFIGVLFIVLLNIPGLFS